MRRSVAWLLTAVFLFSACSLFTKPTDRVTVERQEFVDAWALVQVLANDFFAFADAACTDRTWPAERCRKLPEAKRRAAAVAVGVRAKLLVPESQLDWKAIMALLGVLTSLR